MQKAMYASGVMLQLQTACKKGVKLSCREYVQDVEINRKIVLKKTFSLLVDSMQKALSLVVDSVQKTSRLVVDRENVKRQAW